MVHVLCYVCTMCVQCAWSHTTGTGNEYSCRVSVLNSNCIFLAYYWRSTVFSNSRPWRKEIHRYEQCHCMQWHIQSCFVGTILQPIECVWGLVYTSPRCALINGSFLPRPHHSRHYFDETNVKREPITAQQDGLGRHIRTEDLQQKTTTHIGSKVGWKVPNWVKFSNWRV